MEDKETTDKAIIEEWFTRARAVQNLADLNDLMSDMMEYEHDYGTIVYACVAAAIGATWCMDKSPMGGITGFQAGMIGMNYLTRWMNIDGPWRRVEFNNMLYPQYEMEFQKTISQDAFDWLRTQAREKLAEASDTISHTVRDHWIRIVGGTAPFGYRVEAE